MQRRIPIPDYPRYAYARQRAYRLLCELEIDRLPVDPWKVAEALPNVHICKWTVLRDNCGDDDPLFIDKEGADAKTQHLRGQADYLVVYDDRVETYQRIRWTIAHEIGHIVLGHLTSFDATALCRGTLTEAEYKVLEREADTFAVNLLAPMTIINRLPFIQTKTDFMELCDLSGEASDNCIKELQLLKSGKKLSFPIKEEDVLHRLFYRFIDEFNRTEVPSLSCDDLEIDEAFDDYIECDYWAFTLMAIRKWKLEKELYAALEGSLALYDCEDMVVFVKDAGMVDFVAKNEGIILETLQKYSDSCVKRISAYAAKLRTPKPHDGK